MGSTESSTGAEFSLNHGGSVKIFHHFPYMEVFFWREEKKEKRNLRGRVEVSTQDQLF